MEFKISDQGKFKVISVTGDIENDDEARNVTDKITQMTSDGSCHYCFNLEKATYLNSSGVSIFIHALTETEPHEGSVCMIVAESQVRNVVELAGLDKLIKVYPSPEEFEKEEL